MSIEIHEPQLEALIEQHMATGAFRDVDELLTKALGSLDAPAPPEGWNLDAKNLVELTEPLRGLLTEEEVEALFGRSRSTSRQIDLK